MKHIFTTAILIFIHLQFFGQISITYQNHALLAGDIFEFQTGQYINQGDSGANKTWDFSSAKCIVSKSSKMGNVTSAGYPDFFGVANTSINDGDNVFLHQINQDANIYVGLITPTSVFHFDQPVIKMKFPFSYGNNFTGTFTGEGLYFGRIPSQIYGNYSGDADAYGTLILPGNVSFNNTLRVKTVQQLVEVTKCSYTETINTKFMWYATSERYPLLSVTISQVTTDGGQPVITKSLIFRDNYILQNPTVILSSDFAKKPSYKLFPNPFSDATTLQYNLTEPMNVKFDLFDGNGKHLTTLLNQKASAGEQLLKIETATNKMVPGIYFLRLEFDGKAYLEKIVRLDK